MTPQFKQFVKTLSISAGLIFVGWMTRSISRLAARSMVECNHPCLNRDSKDADCRPLDASLDLIARPDSAGKTTVWYRASVLNKSCVDLDFHRLFFARDLDDSPQQDMDDSYIQITGPSGEVIAPVEWLGNRGGDERIRPYRSMFQGQEVFPHSAGDNYTHLSPGARIWTSSEILSPYRIRSEDRHGPAGDATYGVRESVKVPEGAFPVPPEGFRRLTGYEFRRPGRYSAKFIFNQKCSVRWIAPKEHPIRTALQSVLGLIGGEPAAERLGFRRLRAETGSVEFSIAK